MKSIYFSLLLILCSMTSCTILKSSFCYTAGTHDLEQGNYNSALKNLERAVMLNPGCSRYHNNLATVYSRLGNIKKAWEHVQLAVFYDQQNVEALSNFNSLWNTVMKQHISLGISEPCMIDVLGPPSALIIVENEMNWVYGYLILKFADGKLIEIK